MRGRLWLKNFFNALESVRKGTPNFDKLKTDKEWTEFMGAVMDDIGKNMGCKVIRRRETTNHKKPADMTEDERLKEFENFKKGYWEKSSEYLNIDAVFIDESEYGLHIKGAKGIQYGPYALPEAVVELENNWDVDRICYCMWKVICVRAPVRVLICYQKNAKMVNGLKQRLEDIIWGSSLMKGTDGDLFVIVGTETMQQKNWPEYFSVFEWRHDNLVEVGRSVTV
jgi:hypothetical protein